MFIYLACFGMVFFISSIVQRLSKKDKYTIFFLSIVCILIPSILGGLRDTSIGTDVRAYVSWDFNAALREDNIIGFISKRSAREIFYLAISFLTTKLTGNINVLLFVMQLISMTGVYIGAYKHKKYIPMPIVLTIYLLLYYNDSLNLVRQFMALSILFAGIDNIEKSNYKNFVIYVILAAMFHKTALIALVLVVMHWYLKKCKGKKMNAREVLFVFGMIIVITFFSQIYSLLAKIGVISTKYFYYFEHESVSNNSLEKILYLLEICFVLINRKKLSVRIPNFEFYLVNAYALLGTLQLSQIIYYGNRISIYFGIVNVFFLSQIYKIYTKKGNQRIVNFCVISICLFYWYYIYVYGGSSATIPYISMFR